MGSEHIVINSSPMKPVIKSTLKADRSLALCFNKIATKSIWIAPPIYKKRKIGIRSQHR